MVWAMAFRIVARVAPALVVLAVCGETGDGSNMGPAETDSTTGSANGSGGTTSGGSTTLTTATDGSGTSSDGTTEGAGGTSGSTSGGEPPDTEGVPPAECDIEDVDALVAAVTGGNEGDTVVLCAGLFELSGPLRPKAGMTIAGVGTDQTVLRAADSWDPGTDGLPDEEVNSDSINRDAYLIDVGDNPDVTLAHMRLEGPRLHGAVFANDGDRMHLHHLHLEGFLWSGVRTLRMDGFRVNDCTFVDAGGEFTHTGGALFMTWTADSEFWNNRIYPSGPDVPEFYGFKGRQCRQCEFHHNDVQVGFSFEFPFENDHFVDVHHNRFTGPISIPKHGGGGVPEGGYTFRIHHNLLQRSYALEWSRNGAEVDHNLFQFTPDDDGGNLISSWTPESPGPATFHDNLVLNPGRGVFWSEHVYDNMSFYNNHIIANPTTTPRTEGLFGFDEATNFSTITIRDNIIECVDMARPLFRNESSYGATVENNTLINISDVSSLANPDTGAPRGPTEPLEFDCGVNGEISVRGWTVSP